MLSRNLSKLNFLLKLKSLFVPKHLITRNKSNYYYNKEYLNLELLKTKLKTSYLNNYKYKN